MRVVLSESAVKLAAQFSCQPMRGVVSVRKQRRAAQPSRGDEAFRISSCGAHDITAAHAKTDGSHATTPHQHHTIEKLQDCSGVIQHHLIRKFRPRVDLAELLAAEPIDGDGLILVVSEVKM